MAGTLMIITLMAALALQVGVQPILATEFVDRAVSTTSMIIACEVRAFNQFN
jgi:hypothetical protein